MKASLKPLLILLFSVVAIPSRAAESTPLVLSGSWEVNSSTNVSEAGEQISTSDYHLSDKWMEAVVPGSLLDSYVKAGTYPDPYVGINNKVSFDQNGAVNGGMIPDASIPESVFTKPHWYRTLFTTPSDFSGKTVWLKFAGINWKATVFLNGKKLGEITGAFQRGIFNVTDLLQSGSNALAVRIDPPVVPGTPKNWGCGGDGIKFPSIGLTPATIYQTIGWNFTLLDGAHDRNMGILRDVSLYATGPVYIRDSFMSTEGVPTKEQANLNFKTILVNASDKEQTGTLSVAFADQKASQSVTLAPHESREVSMSWQKFPELVVKNPKLWWPAGFGDQSLYPMTVSFSPSSGTSTEVTKNFGIRSIENKPELGQSVYWVNGHKMFLAGGNWVQDIMQRQTAARDEAQIRMIRQAGFTWVRLWSGSGPVEDTFFDLCDQYGIMVWVESGLCSQVKMPNTDSFWCQTWLDNWADYILLLRHHPCVFNYVGCNEGSDRLPGMTEMVKKHDGTRGYSGNSQDIGQRGSPYCWENIDGYYDYTNIHTHGTGPLGLFGGFCDESGAPCLPVAESIKDFLPEAKRFPVDKEFCDYLDGGGFHRIYQMINEGCAEFGDLSKPDLAGRTGVDNYAFKGQLLNAMEYRAFGELWQREKFDKNGRFSTGWALWTVNNTHPQLCARIYDYSLEPTAGLYYMGRANKPLSLQYNYRASDVTAVNNTIEPITQRHTVIAEVRNLDWSLVWSKKTYIATEVIPIPAESSKIGVLFIPNTDHAQLDDVHFIHLQLLDGKNKVVDDTIYWRSKAGMLYGAEGDFSALNKMPTTQVKVTTGSEMKEGKRFVTVTLDNSSKQLAFFLRVKVLDPKTKDLVRPCFYSDNYFSIPPGESKEITVEYPTSLAESPIIGIEGWNIGTLELPISSSQETPKLPLKN